MKNNDIFSLAQEIVKIGNYAVKKAQQNSLKNGIPTVYSLNNTIFYQLSDGTITMTEPEEYKKVDREINKKIGKSE